MKTDLEKLKEECESCQKCSLATTRTKVVFGKGNINPSVLIIGEAPGKNEDLSGEPFVGAAGKVLDNLMAIAGLKNQYYVANILKCRPPNNRNPLKDEKKLCTPFLEKQISILSPKIIITLGNHATEFMLKDTFENYPGITKLRGTPINNKDGLTIFPTFHPAAAIYDNKKMVVIEEDFKTLGSILKDNKVL